MRKKISAVLFGVLLAFIISIYTASPVSAAPVISNIRIATTTTPYTINFRWNTSVPSDSWVDFDPNGTRYVLRGGVFVYRDPINRPFFEYRDKRTNEMLGRCDGGGDVTAHCVTLLTPEPQKLYPIRIRSCETIGIPPAATLSCSTTEILSFTSDKDTKAPTRPTYVSTRATSEEDRIELQWRTSTDNAPRHFPGYKIYRNNRLIKTIDPKRYIPSEDMSIAPASIVIIESRDNRDIDINVPIDPNAEPAIFYIDYNVSANTTYTYYVTAFDLNGNESLPSYGFETTTPNTCPAGFNQTQQQLGGPFTCNPIGGGGPPPPPPGGAIIITDITATPAAPYTVTFTWRTSIPSDSWVDFDSNGARYTLQGATFGLRDPSNYTFFDFQDTSTGEMVGRCDGGGQVIDHCVKIVTPAPARLYPFRIKSCEAGINCSYSDILSFGSALDTTPPIAPTNLKTTVTGTNGVELTWGPSRDDAPRFFPGYKIFRNNTLINIIAPLRYTPTPPYRDLNVNVPIDLNNTRIEYVDFGAVPGTTYTYHVTGLDVGGNESSPSVPNSIQCTGGTILLCAPVLTRDLGFGDTGEDVKILQQLLIQEKVYPQAIVSGYFGTLTQAAVIRFQIKYFIPATGFVGPLTRAKMNQILLDSLG